MIISLEIIVICKDQVIAHFTICHEEPRICPFNCGVILNKESPVEKHFVDHRKPHLDETFNLLMNMCAQENKVKNIFIN